MNMLTANMTAFKMSNTRISRYNGYLGCCM